MPVQEASFNLKPPSEVKFSYIGDVFLGKQQGIPKNMALMETLMAGDFYCDSKLSYFFIKCCDVVKPSEDLCAVVDTAIRTYLRASFVLRSCGK